MARWPDKTTTVTQPPVTDEHDPDRVYARRPLDYGPHELDRGQVFKLAGFLNDEKLTRLGYVSDLEKGTDLYQCAECHAEFTGLAERDVHGKKRHPDEPHSEDALDDLIEREEKRLVHQAPLYMEKTAASQR